MKDEKKRKALVDYGQAIRGACDIRRGKVELAQSEFKTMQADAKRKYREVVST